jgi:anti-anti-sigma factor
VDSLFFACKEELVMIMSYRELCGQFPQKEKSPELISQKKNNSMVLQMKGRWDMYTAAKIEAKVSQILSKEDELILDMSEVTYFSGAGVLSLQKITETAKKQMKVLQIQGIGEAPLQELSFLWQNKLL